MKTADLAKDIENRLSVTVGEYRFKRGGGLIYRRMEGGIGNEFCILISRKTDWFVVDDVAGIGMPDIIRLYNHLCSGRLTLSEPFTYLPLQSQSRGLYKVSGIESVPAVVANLRHDIINIAVPYFEEGSTLVGINRLVNRFIDTGHAPTVFEGCIGIIFAWLTGDSRLKGIPDHYYKLCYASQGDLAFPILEVWRALQSKDATAQDTRSCILSNYPMG